MKKNILIILIAAFLPNTSDLIAQAFKDLKIKEKYDLFNVQCVGNKPCTIGTYDDDSEFGDSQAYVLDSYITMYKTTKDKAYLYKFMFEAMCVVKNRNDIAGVSNQQCWGAPYHDGNIIGALAHYVYLIKVEEASIGGQTMYSFPEFQNYDWNEPENYPTPNQPPIMITTFWLFADWLAKRVNETLDFYINNTTFDMYYGMQKNNKGDAMAINMQTGFGRAAMYQGYLENNYSFFFRGRNVASDYFNQINFYDNCIGESYNYPLLRDLGNNSYWWYHQGWSSDTRNCSNYQNVKSKVYYTSFTEDISHGTHDINFAYEYYKIQQLLIWNYGENYRVFIPSHMTKFKNTFTKNLYDNVGGLNNISGNGGFNNAVDGADGLIYSEHYGSSPAHNTFSLAAMSYMPLEEFDDGDGSSVYETLMNFYKFKISILPNTPSDYNGVSNKGHADIVAAQWKHECTNLELYNRNVVYNQDFFAKNSLIITPGTSNLPGFKSYAAPTLYSADFIVPDGVTVNMTAGESVALLPGVQIQSGSTYKASIVNNVCTDGQRLSSGNSNPTNENHGLSISNAFTKTVSETSVKPRAVPNPFSNSTNIQFVLNKASTVNLKIIDNLGRTVYQTKDNTSYDHGFNEITVSMENFAQGLYSCILNINNKEIQTINLIKQ